MKRILIPLIVLTLLLTGCVITDPEESANVSSDNPTDTPTQAPETETTPEPTQEPEDTIPVSAEELLKAYDENEVKADNLYKDKTLEVTGIVKSIGKDIFDEVYITLGNDDDFAIISVQCYFKDKDEIDKVAELKEGDEVTVIGICEGGTLNVTLKKCNLK
ncbi:MAG TPA: hypothetical protein GX707_14845 [Epulopiscium sp.]|jgi:PBP1b-binding outer membrane lipoprotein LpoB|nr:hypothetical protein [Candidatus Epulonipiscium sp.]